MRDAEHAATLIATAEARLAEAEETLAAKLDEAALTREAFEAAKADITRIPDFESNVTGYGEKLAVARERFEAAEQAIAHVDRPDLTALLDRRTSADEALKTAQRATIVAAERLRHLEKLAQDLAHELSRLDTLEAENCAHPRTRRSLLRKALGPHRSRNIRHRRDVR